jgi:hypothetical protein
LQITSVLCPSTPGGYNHRALKVLDAREFNSGVYHIHMPTYSFCPVERRVGSQGSGQSGFGDAVENGEMSREGGDVSDDAIKASGFHNIQHIQTGHEVMEPCWARPRYFHRRVMPDDYVEQIQLPDFFNEAAFTAAVI